MKKRQKKGEAAQNKGVKQSYPAEKSAAPVARIITHNGRLYNRTYVRIGTYEVQA